MFCTDTLLVGTLQHSELVILFTRFEKTITFKKSDNVWDLKERGIMVFDFYKNPIKLAQEIKRELYLGKDIQSTQNKIVELMSDTINKKSLKNFIQQ